MSFDDPIGKPTLTTTQAAKILRCSVSSVTRMIEDKTLFAYRRGFNSRWRIPLESLYDLSKKTGWKLHFGENDDFEDIGSDNEKKP